MAAPPVPTPADYFALTRILLVAVGVGRAVRPRRRGSDDQRRFRRSSATAAPCRTSSAAISRRRRRTRAADSRLDDAKTTRLPSEEEVEPWYEAVCALWDDPALYRVDVATRARQIAEERVQRRPVSRNSMSITSRPSSQAAARSRNSLGPTRLVIERVHCCDFTANRRSAIFR